MKQINFVFVLKGQICLVNETKVQHTNKSSQSGAQERKKKIKAKYDVWSQKWVIFTLYILFYVCWFVVECGELSG